MVRLGLLAFIYLAAQISLFAAEVNVVKYRRLWPRGLVQPPLTEADRETMAALAKKETRISEQDVIAFYPYPAANGTYGALFQLDEHGRIALDTLSIERRGSYLFVFINGRPITELAIDNRVSDGKIYIATGLTAADIESMIKEWRLLGKTKL